MGGSVRSDDLTVLCAGCANPVGPCARCPICGTSRCSEPPRGEDQVDEALLGQVGAALAAQLDLATHTATARIETTAGLLDESRSLRRRLRRQRALLRERVAERGTQARELTEALALVDEALLKSGGSAPAHSDWTIHARLPRDRTCPMVARRLVEEHAREDLNERQAEIAMLIVSELATNALLHGEGTISLAVSHRGDRLRIEISDEGHPPHIGVVDQDHGAIGGRGLFLVDQLASGWGATEGTAHVWAELALA